MVIETEVRPIERESPEIIGEEIIEKPGSLSRRRSYLRGWHPELGKLHLGLQGCETLVETDAIRPLITFMVMENG